MKTRLSAALRFYLCASVLVTAAVAAIDPWSQHRAAMSEDGYGGLIGTVCLGALAVIGIIDVFINDVLPAKFSIRCTHRHRHVVFMLIAIGQIALVLALARADDLKPSVIRYVLDAGAALWIAVMGVMQHFRAEEDEREERISQRAPL